MVIPDPDELPKIGDWYLETDTEDEFQVIDVDPDEGLVEVQYYDGNIDEFSLSDWYAMAPQPIEAPEDWAGPMDSLTDCSALAQERETIGDGYQADGDALIVMQLHVQRTNRHRIRVLV